MCRESGGISVPVNMIITPRALFKARSQRTSNKRVSAAPLLTQVVAATISMTVRTPVVANRAAAVLTAAAQHLRYIPGFWPESKYAMVTWDDDARGDLLHTPYTTGLTSWFSLIMNDL
jgi:hypothetical protein